MGTSSARSGRRQGAARSVRQQTLLALLLLVLLVNSASAAPLRRLRLIGGLLAPPSPSPLPPPIPSAAQQADAYRGRSPTAVAAADVQLVDCSFIETSDVTRAARAAHAPGNTIGAAQVLALLRI